MVGKDYLQKTNKQKADNYDRQALQMKSSVSFFKFFL